MRKKQIFRRCCLLSAAILVFFMAVWKEAAEDPEAKEASGEESAEKTVLLEEPMEEPFVNILEKNNYELAVCWEGSVQQTMLDEIKETLEKEISSFSNMGYSMGFLLYDLNTGGGISYHGDVRFYSASTIKAPYVVWMVQTYPDAAADFYEQIQNAIVWSSNEDYFTLINNFGKSGFNEWTEQLGCSDVQLTDGSFGPVTCRNFTRLWIQIYDYFESDDENARMIQELYCGTEESCIYEALGNQYTVYSKAGWSFEGEDSYYTVQNDAGIIMKDGHPYILTVLSDAYEQLDLLEEMIVKVDQAHTELTEMEIQD